MIGAQIFNKYFTVGATARRERRLLFFAGAFVLVGFVTLAIAPAVRLNDWRMAEFSRAYAYTALVWLAGAGIGHWWLEKNLPKRDPFLFPIVMLLCGWGLIIITRLEPNFGMRQTLWFVVSLLAGGIAVRWSNLLRYASIKYVLLSAALLLTALTFLFGVNPSGAGARLWLGCCQGWYGIHLYFQPSELLKLLLIVFLAAYLAEKFPLLLSEKPKLGSFRLPTAFMLPMGIMWLIALALLILQRDLGAGLLLFTLFLVMLYAATGEFSSLVVGLISLVIAGALGYFFYPLVRLRISAWLNPWAQASGDAYQIVQALLALAAGGVFGQGIGIGAPRVIPVVHSDFVFAALVEEWGLIGGLACVALLAILVLRGLQIAARHQQPYLSLLATGISAMLGLQSLLILGGVVRVLPLTGVILPFLSYGGSGLLVNCIMVAWLLRLSNLQET